MNRLWDVDWRRLPNAEVVAIPSGGSAVLVHHFESQAGTTFGPYYMLFGTNSRPMGSFSQRLAP